MTPRVVCAKVSSKPTRSAWSRDVGEDTATGVTYSRRSYYYDREFSDSIVRPTDDIETFPAERVSRRRGYRHVDEGTVVAVESVKPAASVGRHEDPFTRGRVLQSAGGDDGENQRDETRDCAPSTSRLLSRLQSRVPVPDTRAQAQADLEPRSGIAGVDMQAIARGVVLAADVFVRMAEVYQRLRDDDASENEGGEDSDDELFGLELDPYHLEAGPPHRSRSVSRASPRRTPRGNKDTAAAAAIDTSDETQGRTSSDHTIATRTLPPLSAVKRVCYYLIATAILGIAASFGIAMWWALGQGDASTGFTIAGYVIAVDALVAAIVGVVHRPGCRCWKT
ncbi:hypothetical protein F4678DRAFT_427415 [Xylaria arbuscula]|nr:hypothetical protein F4678DRAFT_427415 [Xylaria arbuscula]